MSEPLTGDTDCIVIGAGLAGLACAHGLAKRGRSVRVLEAEDAPGGRARTTWHEGRPVDRGFQVMFAAYPETKRLVREVGIPRADLRPFSGGAAFHDGQRWTHLRGGRTSFATFAGLPVGDRLRLARLGAEVLAAPSQALLDQDDLAVSTEAYLRDRGFSEQAIEGFFRPLFGVIFLDRTLAADPGYFRFLVSMLARGPAVLPTDGLGMIADWASAAIRQHGGVVELGARAVALERGADGRLAGVRTGDGRFLAARHVVLAVEPPAARGLLAPVDPASAARLPAAVASVVTARFALERPLYRGRLILLNAAPRLDDGPRIDLMCQTTNVTRPHVESGPHILLATCVTTPAEASAAGVEDAVARQVERWSPGFPWARLATSLGTVEHAFAQFRPLAGVRRELPGPRTAVPNLILAGDLTAHSSLEGAVASGASAARIVDVQLA